MHSGISETPDLTRASKTNL